MGKILILNGSPKAPKSNSKRYAEIFIRHCPVETAYRNITRKSHQELCTETGNYANSLPTGFLSFLKTLGKKFGTTKRQMQTMDIEGKS